MVPALRERDHIQSRSRKVDGCSADKGVGWGLRQRARHRQRPGGPKALDLVRKHPATLTWQEFRWRASDDG